MASLKRLLAIVALVTLAGCGTASVTNPNDVAFGPKTTSVTSDGIGGNIIRDGLQMTVTPASSACKTNMLSRECLAIDLNDCERFSHDAGVPWDAEFENGALVGTVGEGVGEGLGTGLAAFGAKAMKTSSIVGAGVGFVYGGVSYTDQWARNQIYLANKCADRKGMSAGYLANIRGYIGKIEDKILVLDPHHLMQGGTRDDKPRAVADNPPAGFKDPSTWTWGGDK